MTYGPHGVGRIDGKVVFVRSVVPGEAVDVVVREERRSFTYADLVGGGRGGAGAASAAMPLPAALRRLPVAASDL